MLESQQLVMKAEVEAAQANLLAEVASSTGTEDGLSVLSDSASLRGDEKVDAFLQCMDAESGEVPAAPPPMFTNPHMEGYSLVTAPPERFVGPAAGATCGVELRDPRAQAQLGLEAGHVLTAAPGLSGDLHGKINRVVLKEKLSAATVSFQRREASDHLNFSLGPVPNQLFEGPTSTSNIENGSPEVFPVSQHRRRAQDRPTHAPVPVGGSKCHQTGESVNDFAKMLIRCQGSGSVSETNKFFGEPLQYFKFIRQVEDRILSIFGESDPGHALHLLLEATGGQANKLISSCVMLPPKKDLEEALRLLHKTFGSSLVAARSHIDLVCDGDRIPNTESGLQGL